MNTEEKVLSGFLGLLAVAGIVVLIVLLVKKNSPGPGPTPGPATVPACNVSGGNGVCTSGINTQGKRNCVGGDQLCGVNLKTHKAVHKEDDSCSTILTRYGQKMIKCNDGYQAYIDGDGTSNQGNCLFKCKPKGAACCGITSDTDDSCALNNKEECNDDSGKCKWSPIGCMAP